MPSQGWLTGKGCGTRIVRRAIWDSGSTFTKECKCKWKKLMRTANTFGVVPVCWRKIPMRFKRIIQFITRLGFFCCFENLKFVFWVDRLDKLKLWAGKKDLLFETGHYKVLSRRNCRWNKRYLWYRYNWYITLSKGKLLQLALETRNTHNQL